MRSSYKPLSSSIPPYSRNAALQLVAACGVGYIAYVFTIVAFQVFANIRFQEAVNIVRPNVALSSIDVFLSKPWTILSFGWVQQGFWEWLTNMIWLYTFGSILQALVGYRQLIPLFIYGMLAGGLFFLSSQLFGPAFGSGRGIIGTQASIMAVMTAVLTAAPGYRVYLTPALGIPVLVFAGIFILLMLLQTGLDPAQLMLLAGGSAAGFVYTRLLRKGFRPGVWAYDLIARMEKSVTPDERPSDVKKTLAGQRVDELLDKINQKGYGALTKEEKDFLQRAGKEM